MQKGFVAYCDDGIGHIGIYVFICFIGDLRSARGKPRNIPTYDWRGSQLELDLKLTVTALVRDCRSIALYSY